ncbi:MAG: DUF922 domain-containing protein [Fulvivirga sp.]|nr:DUF922 domain-containing protein [Fulvivirga sp.]
MKCVLFIFLLANCFFARAQMPYDHNRYIAWNAHYKLNWSDFKAKKDMNIFGDAGTAVKIKAKPYLQKKTVHYQVFALFDKSKSWAHDTSDKLLAHEQLHFDIAELYARKIRKKIASLQRKGVRDIKIYNQAIKKLLAESNTFDQRYDRETLHGGLSKKQAFWEKKVSQAIHDLKAYEYKPATVGK